MEVGFWLMNWWVAVTGAVTGVCEPLPRTKALVTNEVCGVSPFFDCVFSSESAREVSDGVEGFMGADCWELARN
jgi:hypothetical protein